MHVEQISFRYLMTLCVLHETGSMRKTATLLRRTQPAISLQIKSLERIVGFDVVEHTRGRIAGEVVEVNEALGKEPGLVNSDPMGRGWFFKMKIADRTQLDQLMDEAAYRVTVG